MALSFQDKIRPIATPPQVATPPQEGGLSFASKIRPVALIVEPEPVEEPSIYGAVKSGFKTYADIVNRGAIGIAAGQALTVSSILSGLDWLGVKSAAKYADRINQAVQKATPPEQNFGDKLASGVGSASMFFVPGIGIAKIASGIAKVSSTMAWFFGGSASTALEAMAEAGSVYNQVKSEEKGEEAASGAATKTFWANVVLIGITNRYGVFNEKVTGALKKALVSAPIEGFQEGMQQIISNLATGVPWDQDVQDSALIGAIIGGGMGAITQAVGIPPRHQRKELQDKARAIIDSGKTPEEAKVELAQTISPTAAEEAVNAITPILSITEQNKGIEDKIAAGQSPTEIAAELAQTMSVSQAAARVRDVFNNMPEPVAPIATEVSAEAFADLQKEVDEDVLERTPSQFQDQFNAFQEKADTDSKAAREEITALEAKFKGTAPRSQEKKNAKLELEATREKLRKADEAVQNTLYEHAIGLRKFLADYIKNKLGLDVSEIEMDNVVDEVTTRVTDGNSGAPFWDSPISEIAQKVVNEYNAENQPSEPSPTQKKVIKTPAEKEKPSAKKEKEKPSEKKETEKKGTVKEAATFTLEQIGNVNPALLKKAQKANTVEEFIDAVVKADKTTRANVSIPTLTQFYDRVKSLMKLETTQKEAVKKGETKEEMPGVPSNVEEEAREDWEENYAEAAAERFDLIFTLKKALKNAKAKEKPELQKELEAAQKADAKIEEEFLAKWREGTGIVDVQKPGEQVIKKDTILYHGTSDENADNINADTIHPTDDETATYGKGIYLAEDKDVAQDYANDHDVGVVMKVRVDKDLLLYTPTKEERETLIDIIGENQRDKIDDMLGGKYDGFNLPEIGLGDGAPEIVIYSNDKVSIDKTEDKPKDKGNEQDTDDSGSGDNEGVIPEPIPDSGDKPGGAGAAVARERGGEHKGGLGKRGREDRKRLGERLTNAEVEKIVSSITEISKDSFREVKLVGEITDEVLEAANQYTPGGIAKEGRGVLDEYYTSTQIVDMVKSLLDFPATKMKVLEPSAGTGNFLYALPETTEHTVVGLEINETTAKIAKIFHPSARIFATPFEGVFMDDRGKTREYANDFDLVIGNPPYGEHRGKYLGLGEEKKLTSYEDYFIKRGLDVLKEGGTLAMVVPSSILRGATSGTFKYNLAATAELVKAYRFPNGAFAGTDIGTDLVVFKKSKAKNDKERLARAHLILNDGYFKTNPTNILGVETKKSGRFGEENVVEGTLDDAMARFYAEHNRPQAEALLKELKIEATEENIEAAEATIEESGDKAKELIKEDTKRKETGRKTIEKKIVQKADKKGEATIALTSHFKHELSDVERALWRKTTSAGNVVSPTEAEKKSLNLFNGLWYLDFNYQQGDIYEKLEKLALDKNILTKEQSASQKVKLEAVLPPQEKIEEIKLSPNVSFVKDLDLKTGVLERPVEKVLKKGEKEVLERSYYNEETKGNSLRSRFLTWIQTLPHQALGNSSRSEVREYTMDQQVRGSDKDRNELIRIRRKIMADNLFVKFLREELNADEKAAVGNAYNRTFNFWYTPDYTKVPMFSDVYTNYNGKPLILLESQRAGIGRLVNMGVGILAHEVGFGKTISGILAAHEVMSRGWAKKPLIVVPGDGLATQWADTIRELVPGAQVNMLGNLGDVFKGDLSSLKIADGSFSIITSNGLKRLSFKDATYEKMAAEFKYISNDLEDNRKKTEREKEKARAKEEGIAGRMKKGTRADLFFEDLGFDHFTFDEVHNANHIVSKVKLKVGQSSEFNRFVLVPSDIGIKTWLATQYIQKENNGRNVNLLSATPFTNQALEYYSILSLVAGQSLAKMGFRNVNDFFGTFMEAEHEYEFKADGTYQKKTDIRRFRNYRQFRKLLDTYVDFRQDASDIKRPNRVQINYEIPKNAMTASLELKAQEIFKEDEKEKGKGAKTLRAITQLRQIAFSPYASTDFSPIIAPEQYREFVENSPKLATVMGIIAQNIKDRPDAGQIIYSEIGVEFFPMLKEYLVKVVGLKADEVAIIGKGTDAEVRLDIKDRFNDGRVKILIGSKTIAEGLNLQKNTSDMHLLSLPWNFTALRQVIGRAWRQGNRFGNVRINQYFIQDSVDVFMSQKLDNKQRRYENAMATSTNEVDVGDVSYSEMKFDLIQDPETRAKLEVEAQKEKMKAQVVQEGAELAFATRKLEKINDLSEEIKDAEEGLVRENAKEEPNDFWVGEHTKNLRTAKKEYNEEISKLREKSIDVDTLLQRKVEGEKKIAVLEAEVARIEETLPARIKELAATLPKRQEFSPGVIDKFVAERAEHNKTFYTFAEAPKEETVRIQTTVKEIKNATGTKVVKTKKTEAIVKEPVKRTREVGTKDERVLKILSSENTIEEKVDGILEVKQAGKKFKDVGERVGGSRKESAAIRTVIGAGETRVLSEIIRRLGWDAVSSVLNKQDILSDVAKPDPVKDVSEGVPPYLAFLKKELYDKIGRTMSFKGREKGWRTGNNISWSKGEVDITYGDIRHEVADVKEEEALVAATKAIEEYPGLLRELVEKLTAVKTFKDMEALDDYLKNNKESGGRYPAEFKAGEITVGLDSGIFGAQFVDAKFPAPTLYHEGKPEERMFENRRGLLAAISEFLNDKVSKKGKELLEEYANKPDWVEKAMKKPGQGVDTELTHGNFKPLERVERSEPEIPNKEATAINLQKVYGFKSVQLGNYMDDATAREHIRHTIGAIVDMSKLLAIDFPKLMNATGLSIAFGARGGGKANAHYEPGKRIINLTKGRGDGSFFHEFVHFLDLSTNEKGYRHSWSSKKDRWYPNNDLDQQTADLMGAITGKRVRKVVEFKPTDNAYVLERPENPIMKMYAEGKTLAEAVKFAEHRTDTIELNGRKQTYQISKSQTYQEIADVYREVVKEEVSVYHEETEYLKGSKQYGSDYWSRPEELLARAGQAYIEDKLIARGMKNDYLTRTTIAEDAESSVAKVYPQGEERKLFNTHFDRVFASLSARYPLEKVIEGEIPKEARFRLADVFKEQAEVGVTEAGEYLANVKGRLKLDFDVFFADALLSGYKMNPFTRRKTPIEAWGATLDNTVILAKEMTRFTAPHEIVHLTLANMEKIPIFGRNGITREKIFAVKSAQMGITIKNDFDDARVDEQLAMDFEKYLENKYVPKGIIRKFFAMLKRLVMQLARAIIATKNDIIKDYYEILNEGVETEDIMISLENTGAVEAFIAETSGEVLDLDQLENAVPRFKLKDEGDKRIQNLKLRFNETLNRQGQLEEDTLGWKTDLLKDIQAKSEIAPEVEATPQNVKEAARFTNRRAEPVGELTERGLMEVSELGFANPQEAQAEIYEYLKRKAELVSTRNRLRDLRQKIASAKRDSRTNKGALRDVERKLKMRKRYLEQKDYYVQMGAGRGRKEQMRMIRRRGFVVRQMQDVIGLSDERAKNLIGGIGRQSIHLMSEKGFNDFMIEFVNRGRDIVSVLDERDALRSLIIEMDFHKEDNVRKALGLPPIGKMTQQQAEQFYRILSMYEAGDTFLTQRQLETIHRTDWGGVRTEREMHAKIMKDTGITREDMEKVSVQGDWQQFKNWLILSRSNPMFAWLVDRRIKAKVQAKAQIVEFEELLNPFVRAARSSREKTIGEKVAQVFAPIDDIVFDYIENENKADYAKEKGMTTEEIELAQFLIARLFEPARQYMTSEYGMKDRENYITHIRRGMAETFISALRQDRGIRAGFTEAVREIFSSQREDELSFKILSGKTGEVLAFEKWFKFSMPRTGQLVPTKNVARASLAYAEAYFNKIALDQLIPEAMALAKVQENIKGYTPKGLPKDPTVKAFVEQFINNAKGRKIKFITEQGSTLDSGLRLGVMWTAFKYLGFRPVLGLANFIGEVVGNILATTNKEKIRGFTRLLQYRKVRNINSLNKHFTGRNPLVELFDPQYGIGSRIKNAALVLFSLASFFNNRFYLRAKMTEVEWQAEIMTDERMIEIIKQMSKWRMTPFYVKSLAGDTAAGSTVSQFSSWAIPIFTTVMSDLQQLIVKRERGVKTTITSEEMRELGKVVAVAGTLWFLAMMIKAATDDEDDEDDRDMWFYITREMNTILGAFDVLTKPENFAPFLRELFKVFTLVRQLIPPWERYERDVVGYGIGDFKARKTAKDLITPSFVKGGMEVLFGKPEKENTKERLVQEALKTGKLDAEAIAKFISPDWDKMEEESKKKKIESVKRLYNIRKNHPADPVVELLLNGDSNKERIETLIEYGKSVGEGNVYEKIKELYRDPNVCADPRKRTGCLVSGQLLKDYQRARR